MIRAFLGLSLPDPVLTALRVQQFLLPLPRKVDPEGFHLTLVFLGEQPDDRLTAAHEEFEALRTGPFEVTLSGLGLFGGGRPRAAWAGVADCPPLMRLQAKAEQAARRAGIDVPGRRFVPHVTLGRFAPPPPDAAMRLERAIAGGMGFAAPPFRVEGFHLFASWPGPDGSRYEVLADYPLRA